MLGVIQLLDRKTGCLASFKALARRKHVTFLLILKMKSKLCKTVFIIEICGLKETLDAVKNPPAMQETRIQSLDQEDPLEKGMATHSSILAWRIPRTEEPGGLQFIGSQRLGYD